MRVGIIGAGVGGTSILRILTELSTVEVIWITDIDDQAEGIKLAKEKGINTGANFLDFIHNFSVDCIIEATGVEKVKKLLMENVSENITVIDGQAANLLMEIVSGRDNLIRELKNMALKLEQDLSHLNEGILEVGKVLEDIKDGTFSLSQMGEELVEESSKTKDAFNKTGEILGFIKSISKQSKILGINSAIEAARAGELGRGFGVVAEEIRTMADSSERSVEEIQQVILEIQSSMDGVQKGINKASNIAHKQAEGTEKASILLEKLSSISREIKEFAEELVSL